MTMAYSMGHLANKRSQGIKNEDHALPTLICTKKACLRNEAGAAQPAVLAFFTLKLVMGRESDAGRAC